VHITEVNALIQKRLVHEIHTSERRSFRGCRRRWHWVFQDFYYPLVTAKPLEFGVAFHNAMETLYEPSTWQFATKAETRGTILNAALEVFTKTCEGQKKNHLAENNRQYLEGEVETDFEERLALGQGMLKYYWNEVAPGYDQNLTPKRVEVEFLVPIQNPDDGQYLTCKCIRCQKTIQEFKNKTIELRDNPDGSVSPKEDLVELLHMLDWIEKNGLIVVLAGRLDMLAEDQYGQLWIVDWKTAARLSRGDVSGQDRDEFLDLDDQIGSYVMALRRKLGLDVRGFIYVELKKAFPEPPTRNKTIRLGRMYSTNKQQSVDYDTYLATVKEHDTKAYEDGLYDEFLEYLQEAGERFHGRYQIAKTDEELEEIERNLFNEAADMVDPNLRIYPSAGRFSCGFCAFRQPCLEKNRQGDFQYMLDTLYEKRNKHYWVKELSTDKQGGE
jgi:hypothetical protein